METEEKARDRIVVVHGLGANNGTTWLLSRRLRARGYDVTQFGYPSLFQSIEGLAERFEARLRRLVEQDDLRPPQKNTRDGHALALAPRQAAAPLADAGLIGVLHVRNEVVRLGLGRRGPAPEELVAQRAPAAAVASCC